MMSKKKHDEPKQGKQALIRRKSDRLFQKNKQREWLSEAELAWRMRNSCAPYMIEKSGKPGKCIWNNNNIIL